MTITCIKDADIALITIDNPPVNVISQAVRQGLMDALDKAAGASRIIITGAGRTFVAGADAKEFGLPPQPPHLPDVLARIEALPCVAAINGAALGGGLEIALACRARVAAPSATLGLPEVTLGIVPGAGGTMRLPRLIGQSAALDLIPEGRTIKAAEAKSIGLVDLVNADPVAAARALYVTLLARPALADTPAPAADPDAVQAARARVAKRMAGQIAPQRAIDLLQAATTLSFAEGVALERATFLELRVSGQAAALRHLFFAERAAMSQSKQLPGTATEVTDAIVVGGGTMGAGIAYAMLSAGIKLTLIETDAAAADRAAVNVGKLYAEAVARGKSSSEKAAADQAERLRIVVGYDDLPAVQIAIEAAYENLAVKEQIFGQLSAALPKDTVLATNTSYLDVDRIAAAAENPARVLGLHFFSPAHVMKLVEIIQAATTTDNALATAFRLAERLGKIPVRAGVCDGFIGNRILTRYRQTCDTMLLDGALPWEVDAALRGFGMAMGPYETQDLSGLDIAYANRARQNWKARRDIRYVPIADRLVEDLKRLGRKTGAGWYDHDGGQPRPSAEVEAVVIAASKEAGVTRKPMNAEEIADRAILAMIDEARHILAEGIADKPADIDLVMVHGYGFPRWRGGLMHHAEALGMTEIDARIAELKKADPLGWGNSIVANT